MEFVCGRCGHRCQRKSDLKKHLQNVKICEAKVSDVERSILITQLERKYNDNAITCQWCEKKFNHSSNYSTHKKTCKKRPITETDTNQSGNNILFSELLNVLKSIDNTMKHLQSNTNTTSNPITQNNYNTNTTYNIIGQQNVNVNAFGNESVTHITNDKMMTYIKNRDIIELIKDVNFNSTVPENHNVKRITSSKDYYKNQFLSIFDEDGKWQMNSKERVLERIVSNGIRVMYKHFTDFIHSNPSQIDEDCAKFTEWVNKEFNNPKQFMRDVFALTLDDELFLKKENPN